MVERLIRLCLAVAVAFVFTGRMEAATAHCARLVLAETHAAARAPEPSEPMTCHEHGEMAAEKPDPAQHDETQHGKTHHDKSGDRCECIGVLKACASIPAAPASAHMEPYEWARPEAAVFVSIEPSPGLRPPRG